jgi:hypothetical protein
VKRLSPLHDLHRLDPAPECCHRERQGQSYTAERTIPREPLEERGCELATPRDYGVSGAGDEGSSRCFTLRQQSLGSRIPARREARPRDGLQE